MLTPFSSSRWTSKDQWLEEGAARLGACPFDCLETAPLGNNHAQVSAGAGESDSKALLAVQALRREGTGIGQGYTVTVVTTAGGQCFATLSGSIRGREEAVLRTRLHGADRSRHAAPKGGLSEGPWQG